MRNSIAILIVASVAVGLLVAGCGSGDDGAQQIDKATFVKQANEICERTSGKAAANFRAFLAKGTVKSFSNSQATKVLIEKTLVPSLETELKEIRALGIPTESKKEAQAFLAAAQKMVEKARANPIAFDSSYNPYEAVEVAGTRFGVSKCPISPVNPG